MKEAQTSGDIRSEVIRTLFAFLCLKRSALLQKAPSSGWLSSGDIKGPSCFRLHTYIPGVLVSFGCQNQIPQPQEFTSHHSRDCKSKIKVTAESISGEGSLLGCRLLPSLCPHMAFSCCPWVERGSKLFGVCSYKGTNPIKGTPPSWTPINLITNWRPYLPM